MASTQELNARHYCRSINADPDELVWHNAFQMKVPRWKCYPGAIAEKVKLLAIEDESDENQGH